MVPGLPSSSVPVVPVAAQEASLVVPVVDPVGPVVGPVVVLVVPVVDAPVRVDPVVDADAGPVAALRELLVAVARRVGPENPRGQSAKNLK
jgi:hypothetical protein